MKRLALGMMCASALACGGSVTADDQDPAKLFESLDKNSDGTLADDEVGEDRKRFYERLVRVGDKNDDHRLTREEFLAAMAVEEKPVESPRPRFGGGDRPMFGPGQMFDRFDRDKDGKFAKSEIPEQAPAQLRERLELVFTSAGKSELTKEEFEKVMAQYGPPRGPEGRRPPGDGERPRPEGEGDRRGPEGDRGREMAREGDRRPGPDGERPPRGPEGGPDRSGPDRRGDRPEGREGFRGFGMRDGGRPMSPLVRILDRDENGKLSRREVARIVDRFEELDRNEDGELDVVELLGFPPGGPLPFGGRPGFAGREDMRREGGDRGREMAREGERRAEGPRDGDHPRPEGPRDGDRPRPEGRPGDRPGPRPEFRPEGGPPRGERGPGREGGRPGDFFARLDKDGDGSISKDEAPERMKERFKDLDANGDGKITGEELRDAIAKEFGAPTERRERRPELEN